MYLLVIIKVGRNDPCPCGSGESIKNAVAERNPNKDIYRNKVIPRKILAYITHPCKM